jgi:curli biogenesis system outer membrane secretion channel CsgG
MMRAEKSVRLYLIIIFCAVAGFSAPATVQAGGAVAVWDLEDLAPVPSAAAEMGEILAAKIIETFEESGNYQVVERQRLQLVLEELNLGTTELISDATRLQIGRLIGARLMVFGSYIVINDALRLDVRKVDVETGLILKAVSKTASGSDPAEWLKIARKAAEELL